MTLEQMDSALRQIKRHVDQMHSQNVQKFTGIRRKRAELIGDFEAKLEAINVRLDVLEEALNG